MMLDGAVTDMIQRLAGKYEYIIMDSAPVGEVSETLSLNRVANTVLYVIKYDSTPLPAIQNALEKLDKSGIRVLGCMVNGVGNGSSKSTEDKKSRTRSTAKPKAKRQSRKEKPKKEERQPKPKKAAKTVPPKPVTEKPKENAAPAAEKPKAAGFGLFKSKKKKDEKPKYVGKHAKGAVPAAVQDLPEEKLADNACGSGGGSCFSDGGRNGGTGKNGTGSCCAGSARSTCCTAPGSNPA